MDNFEFPNNKMSRIQRQKRRDKRLAEELIECRRYNGGDANKKVRQKGELRYGQKMEKTGVYPAHEPIDIKKSTMFGDNLEPLERFLRSKVGLPWSEVYSELNRQLDRSTVSGEHVFQHLQIYMGNLQWGRHKPVEDRQFRLQNDGTSTRFGVHPVTGLLCIVNPRVAITSGPYPKQARFKKQKQKLKLKLRMGLEQKSKPQKAILNARDWVLHFVQNQVAVSNGYQWDELLHRNLDLWEGDLHIILNLTKLEWAKFPVEIWKGNTRVIPANRLEGRIWVKSSRTDKPLRITFVSIWDERYSRIFEWEER